MGAHSPQEYADMMLLMCGIFFALRSGQEHHDFPPQIEKPGKWPYLKYTEDVSKNNPGRLKGRKHKFHIMLIMKTLQDVLFHNSSLHYPQIQKNSTKKSI